MLACILMIEEVGGMQYQPFQGTPQQPNVNSPSQYRPNTPLHSAAQNQSQISSNQLYPNLPICDGPDFQRLFQNILHLRNGGELSDFMRRTNLKFLPLYTHLSVQNCLDIEKDLYDNLGLLAERTNNAGEIADFRSKITALMSRVPNIPGQQANWLKELEFLSSSIINSFFKVIRDRLNWALKTTGTTYTFYDIFRSITGQEFKNSFNSKKEKLKKNFDALEAISKKNHTR
ncbi:MAG: hypothetical protein LBI95_00455, partial [Holosporales bacterium]|nr:hypothetical protein [Holosporales bacterium]